MAKKGKKEAESYGKDSFDPLLIESKNAATVVLMLQSPELDVILKACEAIYRYAEKGDENKAILAELGALEPISRLIKHEDKPVRRSAVMVLGVISTRMALRELEGLDYLIEMLGANVKQHHFSFLEEDVITSCMPSGDLSDLHVDALLVISNCLEDEDTMQLIQQTGALDKLMQFARTATLVDVQRKAVNAILRAAQNSKNKKILHDHGVEKILVGLLGPDNADIRETACLAITVMCENESSKVSFGKWGKPLVQLLQNDYGEVKEAAALALSSLTTANMNNSIAVYKARGIEPLVQLLANEREGVVAHVAAVLTNMSSQNILRSNIQAKGVMTALVGPLQSASSLVQSKAALAVSAFACDSEAREEFRIAGGLVALVWLLNSNINEVRRNACWAVFVCASDEPTCLEMFRLGALEILQEINLSTCRKNNFSEAALQKLFEGNLSIKYSLYGGLSSSDIIVDGFYDPGRVKPGKKVLPLEDLFKMEVNQQRPIILVNGRTGDE
uniref:Armadillo repeat containing 3 n=1 Tax=Erpetoichthys calabaricus TaxID=27687 RepID=A0A8C4RSZ9_ERPCA